MTERAQVGGGPGDGERRRGTDGISDENAEGWQWPGGAGGENTGSFKVTAGEELKIVVGCAGAIHSGTKAFPNGGLGAQRSGTRCSILRILYRTGLPC